MHPLDTWQCTTGLRHQSYCSTWDMLARSAWAPKRLLWLALFARSVVTNMSSGLIRRYFLCGSKSKALDDINHFMLEHDTPQNNKVFANGAASQLSSQQYIGEHQAMLSCKPHSGRDVVVEDDLAMSCDRHAACTQLEATMTPCLVSSSTVASNISRGELSCRQQAEKAHHSPT